MEASESEDSHAGLANMCAGEALEADSPPPVLPPAPVTPERKIKQEKFDQDYATFLLNSHAWSRSLGPNTTIELSPSQSDRAASSAPFRIWKQPMRWMLPRPRSLISLTSVTK